MKVLSELSINAASVANEAYDDLNPEILGLMAVRAANNDAAMGEKAAPSSAEELEAVSLKIACLREEHKDMLDDYCCRNAPPHFKAIVKNLADQGAPTTWSEWLIDGASDEQLLKFLQCHAYQIKQEQSSEEVQLQIKEQRQDYKDDVINAIAEGWLPFSAYSAVQNVDNVPVYLGDIVDTLIEDRSGYCWKGYVVIASPSTSAEQNHIRRIAKHEFNHAVLGRYGARWLDEAITEHIANAFNNGQPHMIDPSMRKKDSRIYRAERELLGVLLEEGDGEPIPISMATMAYAEPMNMHEHKLAFVAAIEKKWGRHMAGGGSVLGFMADHVSRLEKVYLGRGAKSKYEAERLALGEAKVDLLHRPERIFGRYPNADLKLLRQGAIFS